MVKWLRLRLPLQEVSILDLGARVPHASWPGNQNRSSVVTDSIKTLKHGPQQNKLINLKKKKKLVHNETLF